MFAIKRWWQLAWWICMGVAILVLDYFTGPNIAISYLFLVPVVLAAHHNGRVLGISFAIVLPLSQLCFHFAWGNSFSLSDSMLNAAIRILILLGAAVLVDRVHRQAEEIRTLRGILPICMHCKKIHTSEQRWQQLEAYITEHSEAKFSHTFCPDCGKKYYADLLGTEESSTKLSDS